MLSLEDCSELRSHLEYVLVSYMDRFLIAPTQASSALCDGLQFPPATAGLRVVVVGAC